MRHNSRNPICLSSRHTCSPYRSRLGSTPSRTQSPPPYTTSWRDRLVSTILLLTQSPLHPRPNLVLLFLDLIFTSIKPHVPHLIERILRTLLKLLSRQLYPLVLPQPGVLVFYLWQPPLLKRLVRRLEPPLRMTLAFHLVQVRSQRQCIERVIDTRGVDGGRSSRGSVRVELAEV